MLKSILKRLNGHAFEPQSLTEALAQLARDRAEAESEITRLQVERKQALLDDASDERLDKIERLIDRANVQLEKLAIAEGLLREKLKSATAAVRDARWSDLLAQHRSAASEYIVAANAAAERFAALNAVIQTAQHEGFAGRVAGAMPAAPNINGTALCSPDIIRKFEASLSPVKRPNQPAPRGGIMSYIGQPGGEHYDPTRPPGPVKPSLQHAVALSGGIELTAQKGSRSAPRLPDDIEPLDAGQVRVVVLRNGIEINGQQSHSGRRIRMSRDAAISAARSGAVSIIEDQTQRDVERISEPTFQKIGSVSEIHTPRLP